MTSHQLPPRLPEDGPRARKYAKLFSWLNQFRDWAQANQMHWPHGLKGRGGHGGIVLEGNFGGDEFSLPAGIAVREMSVCQKVDNGDGTTTTKELFVRGLFSVVHDKDADGNPIDSEGNKLDETTDPPLPDLTEEDETSGFEISVT